MQVEGDGMGSKTNDRIAGISNVLVPADLERTDGLYCHTGKPRSQDFRVQPSCE